MKHLLKAGILPHKYESVGENETRKVNTKIKTNKKLQKSADVVF